MEQFLDSPMMQEFLNDPEKMEQSRQALLNNPMAMQMMQQNPQMMQAQLEHLCTYDFRRRRPC